MSQTAYHAYPVSLSKGQKESIASAYKKSEPVTLKLSHGAISGGSESLQLTNTQIARLNKAKDNGVGSTITLSKAQLSKHGGFLQFLAPLIGPIVGSLLGGNKGDGISSLITKAKELKAPPGAPKRVLMHIKPSMSFMKSDPYKVGPPLQMAPPTDLQITDGQGMFLPGTQGKRGNGMFLPGSKGGSVAKKSSAGSKTSKPKKPAPKKKA